MAATAVYLAVMKHQTGNVLGGAFTFYLVATAWVTVRRKNGETRIFDWLALILPLAARIARWISGVRAERHQMWSENGVPVGMNFFMGSVLLLAAAGDVRMMVPGGLFSARRITRHLCTCVLRCSSPQVFLLGTGQQVFPPLIAQSNVLFVPALLPLLFLIFWLFRVRFTNAYQRKSMRPGGDVYSLPT